MAKNKSDGLHPATKLVLALIAVLALAVGGGYIGAGLRGGNAEESGNWLDGVRERGELRVGIAIAPPMTMEVDGVLGGPNILPLENLAEQMDVELTPVAAEWSNIVAGVQAGHYDVAAFTDQTVERNLAISFTDSVFDYEAVFIVPEDSPYSTHEELLEANATIAIGQGVSYSDTLVGLGYELLELDSFPNAVAAVQAGRAEAAVADYPFMQDAAQQDPSLKLIIPDPPIYAAASNYGVAKDIDPHSMSVLNAAIATARDSGQMTLAYREVGFVPLEDAAAEGLVKE